MRNIRLFIIALFGIASLWVGCSDSQKITGTSEEENELIARQNSSSSLMPESISSSSSEKVEPASSSDDELPPSIDFEGRSSNSTTKSVDSSSSSGNGNGSGPVEVTANNRNTFGYYIEMFALDIVQFDSTVKASAIVDMEKPGLYRITKDEVDSLKLNFPTAVRRYSDIITAVKNDSAECGLYLYNVQGDVRTAGLILNGITSDTVVVLDIVSENCEPTNEKMFGFLFTYCGEMNSDPELVRITVNSEIPGNKCPDGRIKEWIKEN
ncbi:MAG: hypothetical protein IK012_03410 [Fibrobacter sp.]|uniref:hypothetical protein n=1 Tax=Fibrobacter sp. TaxID=35828 RepID=UPI0025BCFDB9|nr:hypothetical protein [Fibrobacter sp.]MBR4784285.1 hypothetical protein [Fibrobacter sp.]